MLFPPETIAEMSEIVDDSLPYDVPFFVGEGSTQDTGDEYDPLTDLDSDGGGTPATPVVPSIVLRGEQIMSDPERYAASGLSLLNAVTLKVRPKGTFKPQAGMRFTWAGTSYTVQQANPVAPSGVPVLYIVDGVG